ncbi:MAG: hypothetical protein FWC91_14725 [Defluviitaleaceae bacterium]|nr:hypothetical protein [Defluviitaleaceae bacterium]
MKKYFYIVIVLLIFSVLLVSCDEILEIMYTCHNFSSHDVTLLDANDRQVLIPAGRTQNVLLFDGITLADLYYTPANLVFATLSRTGKTVTFRDR